MKSFETFVVAAVCALLAGPVAAGEGPENMIVERSGVQGDASSGGQNVSVRKRLNAREWLQKGVELFEAKQYAAARNAFASSIEINEGHRVLYGNALAMHMRFRHHEMANYYLEKMAELESNLALAYHYRGVTCEALGRDQEAVSNYTRVIALDPDNTSAYLARAGVFQRTGDFRRGVDSCSAVLKRDPQNGAAYLQRGRCYLGLEFLPLAIRDFDRSIELRPAYARAYLERGISYEKVGAPDKAAADFKTAAGLGLEEARDALRARGIQD